MLLIKNYLFFFLNNTFDYTLKGKLTMPLLHELCNILHTVIHCVILLEESSKEAQYLAFWSLIRFMLFCFLFPLCPGPAVS